MASLLWAVLLVSLAWATASSGVREASKKNSGWGSLIRAWDASLAKTLKVTPIQTYQDVFRDLPLLQLLSCSSDPKYFPFPEEEKDDSRLWKSNELRVGIVSTNTSAGDYTVDPPTGFLPRFLTNVLYQLNDHYRAGTDKKIVIKHVPFPSEEDALAALKEGTIDMTDQNFAMDAMDGSVSRTSAFTSSCTAFAFANYFAVPKATMENVRSVKQMVNFLIEATEGQTFVVGVRSHYDFTLATIILPRNKNQVYTESLYASDEALRTDVALGAVAMALGNVPLTDTKVNVFDSEIVTMRAAFFPKTVKYPPPDSALGLGSSLLGLMALLSLLLSL